MGSQELSTLIGLKNSNSSISSSVSPSSWSSDRYRRQWFVAAAAVAASSGIGGNIGGVSGEHCGEKMGSRLEPSQQSPGCSLSVNSHQKSGWENSGPESGSPQRAENFWHFQQVQVFLFSLFCPQFQCVWMHGTPTFHPQVHSVFF